MNRKFASAQQALMIDDDVEYLAVFKRVLRTLDIELTETSTKKDFIYQLTHKQFNMCFIDLNLTKELDGYHLIERVRASFSKDLTIFVVSSVDRTREIAHALELGATDYFIKPVDTKILDKKLAFYFGTSTSGQNSREYDVLPTAAYSVQIESHGEIEYVDEFGLRLRSRNLMPKGTLVRLTGDLIEDISGQKKLLTSVMSSMVDHRNDSFVYYLEFEDLTKDCLVKIRNWIGRKILGKN